MAEEKLNLYQKLAKVRAISDVAQKDLKGYGYTYTSLAAILSKVTSGMKKYGVSLIPSIVPGTSTVVPNTTTSITVDKTGKRIEKTTTEMLFCADMIFTWINDDNPEERIDVPWFVTGAQSDPSQAAGSGLSYTLRQFLTNYFQIAQTNTDVDAYRSKQKEAAEAEGREIAASIIEEFDKLLKSFLPDNQDKKEQVIAFIKRYHKTGDYFKINDPMLASKLLNDFKEKFIGKKEE